MRLNMIHRPVSMKPPAVETRNVSMEVYEYHRLETGPCELVTQSHLSHHLGPCGLVRQHSKASQMGRPRVNPKYDGPLPPANPASPSLAASEPPPRFGNPRAEARRACPVDVWLGARPGWNGISDYGFETRRCHLPRQAPPRPPPANAPPPTRRSP